MTSQSGPIKLKRYALSALTMVFISAAIGLSSPSTVGAANPTPQVIVANTSSQPVPTAAQGTTDVQGSVDVMSLPPIDLAPGSTVRVGNLVVVRPVETAPQLPVRATGTIVGGGDADMYTVPTGYRLVIENVSCALYYNTDDWVQAWIEVGTGSTGTKLFLTLSKDGNNGLWAVYSAAHSTRLYAEAGEHVVANVSGDLSQGSCWFTGYLVPGP